MQVSVLSPAKVVVKTNAEQVQVPGTMGYMAILPEHAAMVAELGPGELKLKADAGEQRFFISGGYVDVSKEQVTVLVDTIEKAGDIDTNRAEASRKRALDRLEQKVGVDLIRAQAALARAQQRLLVAGRK